MIYCMMHTRTSLERNANANANVNANVNVHACMHACCISCCISCMLCNVNVRYAAGTACVDVYYYEKPPLEQCVVIPMFGQGTSPDE